jgi:hypothetical protein
VDEEVGVVIVDGMGVNKKVDVAICTGFLVTAGLTDSGVDADSVANRSVVGVGADVPRLQASRAIKNPTHRKNRLLILFLNGLKVKLLPCNNFRTHTPTTRT